MKKLWNKDYILLLQGGAVSVIGDVMYSVAIGYWVYETTGSSALMGIMSSISMFVTMFLSPFCGSIVDKCNRKWLMAAIDTAQGLLMLTVGILAYMDQLNVPIVLFAALLAAFGSVFYSPAHSTLMLDLIPRDDMVRGQSISSGISSAIDLVGTAFSGAMVAFLGVPLIVTINGLSNLYSAATMLFINVPQTIQQGLQVSVKNVLTDSKNALRIIFSDRFLVILVPCLLILNFLGAGPLTLILPFCMEKGFSVDMYGYFLTVYTTASFLCVTLLGIIKFGRTARFWIMALGFTLAVPCLILCYCSTQFLPMCIAAFFAGFLNCAGNVMFNAALMLALPEENRGAILGFIRSASVGGAALSALTYGLLCEIWPFHVVFSVGCAISLVPMLYMCFHKYTKKFILEH